MKVKRLASLDPRFSTLCPVVIIMNWQMGLSDEQTVQWSDVSHEREHIANTHSTTSQNQTDPSQFLWEVANMSLVGRHSGLRSRGQWKCEVSVSDVVWWLSEGRPTVHVVGRRRFHLMGSRSSGCHLKHRTVLSSLKHPQDIDCPLY